MDGLEQIVKSIIEDNRQFRDASNNRFSKLLEVMQTGTSDQFTDTINELFNEVIDSQSNDETSKDDVGVQGDVGSAGDAADAMGGQAAPQE